MNSSSPSHGQNAVPVELAPDPGFCVKTRVQPDGHKLFVNICHHPAIPSAEGHLPLVLSERRDGSDKGERLKLHWRMYSTNNLDLSRTAMAAKDAKLRGTLIEVALSRIEEKTGFTLSRSIATPNIKSKGAIPPRTARIPAFWASSESTNTARIQEHDAPAVPSWSWNPTREGCRIVIQVPDMTKPLHTSTTLDLEARRLIFTAGTRYHLDTPLLPPNQGTRVPPGGTKFLPTTVSPDSAVAEWDVKNKELVVQVKWASVVAREKEKEPVDV